MAFEEDPEDIERYQRKALGYECPRCLNNVSAFPCPYCGFKEFEGE